MNLFDKAKHLTNGAQIISMWLGDGGITVDQSEAQRRADICLRCPRNSSGEILASSVAAAVKRHLELKASLKLRVSGEKSLNTCAVCLCPLRLKIWVPQDIVTRSVTAGEAKEFPENCWQLNKTIP